MMNPRIDVMIMSGVEDGHLLSFDAANGDGVLTENGIGHTWTLRIGRREDNDICLRYDTFSSRHHALLHLRSGGWVLEDMKSKNGTFIEQDRRDMQVNGETPLMIGQLFRVGRTWLRLQPASEA